MNIESIIKSAGQLVIGWPLMLAVIAISIVYTIALKGVQFTYLWAAFKTALFPSTTEAAEGGEISPFQAFIATINASIGNGSIAGMGTAIYLGGPGAVAWLVVFGFLFMVLRFAEVYISALYGNKAQSNNRFGGPMLYLQDVPGGTVLPYLYAFFCLIFGLCGGNAAQANAIKISLLSTWSIAPVLSGIGLFIFVLYILLGGAERIVAISLALVPVKVVVFVVATFSVLVYNATAIPEALGLMISGMFGVNAIAGGVAGFSLEQAIRSGMTSSLFSTESGLGSAAILFGSAGSSDPVKSGLMGMVSTFFSTLTGFTLGLCMVSSGAWTTGLNSTALTIATLKPLFGSFAGWIVSFLSISFGFGVLVSYAFIARVLWLFLTGNRWNGAFMVIYSLCTLAGALMNALLLWDAMNIVVGITLIINLFGMVMLLPKIRPTLMESLRNFKA